MKATKLPREASWLSTTHLRHEIFHTLKGKDYPREVFEEPTSYVVSGPRTYALSFFKYIPLEKKYQ